ncbi:hypothetical protein C8R44DRAFT_862339 [Mycena epipterygia]|nr:hypothetical protein C8R44DRAFT_862339 [Mycena epipterygia]
MVGVFRSFSNDNLIGPEGLYVNLFILAIHTLSRRKTAGRIPLLVASWAMFILGTTGIVVRVIATVLSARVVQQIVQPEERENYTQKLLRTYGSLAVAEDMIFAINNLVAGLYFSR